MKRFGYATDPLCLVACALYVFNRWYLAPRVGGHFLQGQFNDLLLIPAALPMALWLQRRLGCRTHDQPPQWREIALHLTVWAIMAEGVVPRLVAHTTADWRDLVAYTGGAVVAGVFWQGGSIA